LFLYNHIVTLV